jgi:hypothetical protein
MPTMPDGINSLAPGIAKTFPGTNWVAGYLNGTFVWSQADWDLFPHANHVTITVTASADIGDVLDVETGDATPPQAEAWIAMRKAAGLYRPTIYCNLSTVPAVRAGTGKYVLGTDYDLWIAVFDNSTASPYAGCAAKQYESTTNYDLSEVYDVDWPHRAAPVQKPAPVTGFSQTATESFTDFGWTPDPKATSYDFQLVQGRTQAFRKSVTSPNIEKVPTEPGKTYAWHVSAINSYGSSGWSSLRAFVTPAVGFPAPSGLRVTTDIVSVSWDAVSVNGQSPDGYDVVLLDAGRAIKTVSVKGTTAVLDGLTRNKVYELQVTASGGQGVAGSAKISVTA